jgi:hypothetical protein
MAISADLGVRPIKIETWALRVQDGILEGLTDERNHTKSVVVRGIGDEGVSWTG